MNTGGPRRRSDFWWRWHGKRRRLHPDRIQLRSGPIHQRDVDRYRRDPDARADGGTPVCVVRLQDGTFFAREGAHRITAARLEGRKVHVLLVDETKEQGR